MRVYNDGEHDWYEVDRDVYICALDYPEAVRQQKEFGYGWSLDHLRSLGFGPFAFVGFQPYPQKGKT